MPEELQSYLSQLLDAITSKTKSQRRSINRELKFTQKERKAASVVFVAMCCDTSDDAIGVLAQISEIRKDKIDPEHVEIGEHQTAIKKKDLAFQFDTGAVTADFTKTTEERHRNWCPLGVSNLRGFL